MLRLAVLKTLSMPPDERSWGVIEDGLRKAATRDPGNVSSLVLKADVQSAQGKLVDARQTLHTALKANPKEPLVWNGLIGLESQGEHWTAVETLLAQMRKQFDDGLPYRLAMTEYQLRRFGDKSKNQLRSLAEAPASYSAADRKSLAAALARASLAIRDFEQGERLYRFVAAEDPSNLPIRLILFDLAWQTRRADAMDQALSEVERIEHKGPYWHYGKALQATILAKGSQKPDDRKKHFAEALGYLDDARVATELVAAGLVDRRDQRRQ